MPEMQQFLKVFILVVQYKFIWRHIHQLHQFPAFIDDGGPVAPGKNSREKCGYFYILFF
jgi:hypothetical protein